MEEQRSAQLVLANGETFVGTSFGYDRSVSGEVVFSTGMVGYPESLTDPSYRGQILVLTHPLIGNYGVPELRVGPDGLPAPSFESDRVQIAGLVVHDASPDYSHRTARSSLAEWLRAHHVPAVTSVDTRALTMELREHGVTLGRIEVDGEVSPFVDPNSRNLVAEVSCSQLVTYAPLNQQHAVARILLIDCGVKASIIRALLRRGCMVHRVPWDFDVASTAGSFDGIVISNGPGDPKRCDRTIGSIRRAIATNIPILGICLGNQLLALAAGADTYKLMYGHRSQNQPCVEAGGHRCFITTQNHGYAIVPDTLPHAWEAWFTNANDQTIEGIRHARLPFLGVQFHPEANPGPEDTAWVFDEFLGRVRVRTGDRRTMTTYATA